MNKANVGQWVKTKARPNCSSELSEVDCGACCWGHKLLAQCKSPTGDSTCNLFIKRTLKF